MSQQRTHPAKGVLAVRRISQTAAAVAIGCSRTHLCLVLNGEVAPSDDLKRRLSTFLGEPVDALFADIERCVCGRAVLA